MVNRRRVEKDVPSVGEKIEVVMTIRLPCRPAGSDYLESAMALAEFNCLLYSTACCRVSYYLFIIELVQYIQKQTLCNKTKNEKINRVTTESKLN